MTVRGDWPSYLLKNIPPEIRVGIEREAGTGSMIEVVRRILCESYSLDCAPVPYSNQRAPKYLPGTNSMNLYLQPELWKKIKRDAKKRKKSHRAVIIEALSKHYQTLVT